jgi:hypothetical protein
MSNNAQPITTDSMLGQAYLDALRRMSAEPMMLSAAEKAFELHPHDDGTTEAIVYVKIIRFDAATCRLDPDSGGLLAEI